MLTVELPCLRVGDDFRRELRVDAEAVEDHEEPVLVAGFRFADVEAAVEWAVRAPE